MPGPIDHGLASGDGLYGQTIGADLAFDFGKKPPKFPASTEEWGRRASSSTPPADCGPCGGNGLPRGGSWGALVRRSGWWRDWRESPARCSRLFLAAGRNRCDSTGRKRPVRDHAVEGRRSWPNSVYICVTAASTAWEWVS
ncbi:hypothetical protein GCM10010388_68440 [Streptomyces mauvecolor]